MHNSKTAPQESIYAELSPEHLSHAVLLVGKALLKRQKHSCQRRRREFIYKLIPEPQSLRVTHNLVSVPQLADSFSKNLSLAFGFQFSSTVWLVDWAYLKYYGADGGEKCKNLVKVWNKIAQHLFNEQASGNSSLWCWFNAFQKAGNSLFFSGSQNKACEFISLC